MRPDHSNCEDRSLDGQAQAYLLRDGEAQGDLFRQLKAVGGELG